MEYKLIGEGGCIQLKLKHGSLMTYLGKNALIGRMEVQTDV